MSRSIGWVALFPCLLLACSPRAMADDFAASSQAATKLISRVLPEGWTMETRGSRLVLRPGKRPLFVNTFNGPGAIATATPEEIYRNYKVDFDYQIGVRFEPKLSLNDVRLLMAQNLGIHEAIQHLERNRLAQSGRHITFSGTKEGQRLSDQRDQLLRSFRPVPAGYVGDVSVFINTTSLGYATFFRKEEQQECEGVGQRILGQLTLYTNESGAKSVPTEPAAHE